MSCSHPRTLCTTRPSQPAARGRPAWCGWVADCAAWIFAASVVMRVAVAVGSSRRKTQHARAPKRTIIMMSAAVISSSSFMLHAGSRPLLPHDSASPLLRVRMDYRDNNYRSGVDNSGAWSSLDKNLGEPEGLVSRFIWKGPGMSLMYYMEEMQELWAKADTDGDGYLSTADTINLMQSCEKEYSEEQVKYARSKPTRSPCRRAPRTRDCCCAVQLVNMLRLNRFRARTSPLRAGARHGRRHREGSGHRKARRRGRPVDILPAVDEMDERHGTGGEEEEAVSARTSSDLAIRCARAADESEMTGAKGKRGEDRQAA